MAKIIIPTISDKKLLFRYSKIKPIVEYLGVNYLYRYVSLEEMRHHSYTFEINP